jgi:sec-independent protein translocase protein TatC
VVLLVRMGLLTVKKLRQIRPYVIVGAFIVSAVVTPPDVFSQLILALPLIILYEVGIIAARLPMRRQHVAQPQPQPQPQPQQMTTVCRCKEGSR